MFLELVEDRKSDDMLVFIVLFELVEVLLPFCSCCGCDMVCGRSGKREADNSVTNKSFRYSMN